VWRARNRDVAPGGRRDRMRGQRMRVCERGRGVSVCLRVLLRLEYAGLYMIAVTSADKTCVQV